MTIRITKEMLGPNNRYTLPSASDDFIIGADLGNVLFASLSTSRCVTVLSGTSVHVDEDLDVHDITLEDGDLVVGGSLTASGSVSAKSIMVEGDIVAESDLGVTNDVRAGGSINTYILDARAVDCYELSVGNDINVDRLSTKYDVHVKGNIYCKGDIRCADLIVGGRVVSRGKIEVRNGIRVGRSIKAKSVSAAERIFVGLATRNVGEMDNRLTARLEMGELAYGEHVPK